MIAYLRITDKNKRAFVSWHAVWDLDLFLASQREHQRKEGGTVAEITEGEYRAEKWPAAPGKT